MNIDRSRTAEYIYSQHPEFEVKSAGVCNYAYQSVTAELVTWADIVLCMTDRHKAFIEEKFANILTGKKIGSLDIQDEYEYMHPSLIEIITKRVDAWLLENQIVYLKKYEIWTI
jgi:predicted protein tyrosine phosphatase